MEYVWRSKLIVILTGAYKNIGDHLIGFRAKELLKKYVDEDILELDRKENLDNYLDEINSSKALILCGGPAYNEKIYPNIYKLCTNLDDIKVPIIPFGLGLSKSTINEKEFKFSEESITFIKKIHSSVTYSSCRDNMTKDMLETINVNNVIMTGCPVWYELSSIGKSFKQNNKLEKVVFTTPAHPMRLLQTLKLMLLTKKNFRNAVIYNSFHRGFYHESLLKVHYSLSYLIMAIFGKFLGFKNIDVSKKLSDLDLYKECDFHLGYRVHAHLFFLSNRIPSILINEDIRGKGMSESLTLEVFNYNDNQMLQKVDSFIKNMKKDNFKVFDKLKEFVDKRFDVMKDFLENIK
jgi:flavodoxin